MNEDDTRQLIREELQTLFASDRYTFQKNIQMFDGRNILLGGTTGTKIGTATTQKLAFYGKTPIVQQASINAPNTQGGTYNQTDANTIVTATTSILTLLRNYGFIA